MVNTRSGEHGSLISPLFSRCSLKNSWYTVADWVQVALRYSYPENIDMGLSQKQGRSNCIN